MCYNFIDFDYNIYKQIFWKGCVKFERFKLYFCKIANGEIPSYTIYEDDKFRAIFDLGPATKGHAIILPKEHFRNVFDLDENYTKEALVVAQKLPVQ